MRRQLLLVCGIALLSATSLSAQQSLLPKQFNDWKLAGCVAKPVVPAIWKETGMRDYSTCKFSAGDKIGGDLGSAATMTQAARSRFTQAS